MSVKKLLVEKKEKCQLSAKQPTGIYNEHGEEKFLAWTARVLVGKVAQHAQNPDIIALHI